ncbi:hypothetical protein H0267_16155 [Halobacillus sp. KCTC 3957]|uniref:UDP-glucose/GDP-mannose dehydrogenase C-terminal domain-containing protein n=1 Tax=Halobacillus yeomjeoni TaxID=311194 RepID=A0A931HY79_9BACI|nr:hypothetical protein [Halobacillus yeomjeoni]
MIYGVTYKPDVKDIRGSSAIQVIEQLVKKGVDVKFHDPFVDEIVLESNVSMKGVKITDELLGSVGCVLILTDHIVIPVDKIINKLYVDKKYALELNRAKIFFTCGSVFQYPVLKFYEAPAC